MCSSILDRLQPELHMKPLHTNNQTSKLSDGLLSPAAPASPLLTTTRVRNCDIATFYLGFDINMSSNNELSGANSSADITKMCT